MSNGSGSYRSTPEASMKAFDKLPKRLREAIANADTDWAVQPIRTMFENGSKVDVLLNDLKRWEYMQRAANRMKKVWGAGHPQAIAGKPREISERVRKRGQI